MVATVFFLSKTFQEALPVNSNKLFYTGFKNNGTLVLQITGIAKKKKKPNIKLKHAIVEVYS